MRGWGRFLFSLTHRPAFWRVGLAAPRLIPGAVLHRAALWAAEAGRRAEAGRLLEAAADRYREELVTEPLARLRVHQLMLSARAGAACDPATLEAEVERLLLKLPRIESLRAPFATVPAAALAGVWGDGAGRVREPARADADPGRALQPAA